MSTLRDETRTLEVPPGVDPARERRRVEEILRRVLSDLAMIADRDLALGELEVEVPSPPVAAGAGVHIAFKLALRRRGEVRRGALLVPLPEAIALACYLMMVDDAGVLARRSQSGLDETLKDSMLEVANFIAGATEGALRDALREDVEVRTEGCQGLNPGAVTALRREPGEPRLAARATTRLHTFPEFTLLLELPLFPA